MSDTVERIHPFVGRWRGDPESDERSICPKCGQSVHDSWVSKHLASNCKHGGKAALEQERADAK